MFFKGNASWQMRVRHAKLWMSHHKAHDFHTDWTIRVTVCGTVFVLFLGVNQLKWLAECSKILSNCLEMLVQMRAVESLGGNCRWTNPNKQKNKNVEKL